nr:hypothetical protein [Mycoplasmopsis bovis]
MTYLPKKINENIFRSIYYEDDLDKLAGYYKLSENFLIGDDSYVVDDLWKNFIKKMKKFIHLINYEIER